MNAFEEIVLTNHLGIMLSCVARKIRVLAEPDGDLAVAVAPLRHDWHRNTIAGGEGDEIKQVMGLFAKLKPIINHQAFGRVFLTG